MKKLSVILIALLIANSFWSCEKDDICAEGTPTTPSLIVEFYDKDNRSELKPITNLKYYAEGMETEIDSVTGSKVELPLRTNAQSTKWALILTKTTNNVTTVNTDFVEFKYQTRNEYVSRACGYKTLFTLNQDSDTDPNPFITDNIPADDLWIQGTVIEQTNVEDENEVHVKIYF